MNAGHTLYAVQKIHGHPDAKVTERYAHLSQATLFATSSSVSAAMTGGAGNVEVKALKERRRGGDYVTVAGRGGLVRAAHSSVEGQEQAMNCDNS